VGLPARIVDHDLSTAREFFVPQGVRTLIMSVPSQMTQTALERLSPTNRVLKRAQYEAFAFSLYDGDVLIRNESHLNPADHEYRVTIVDGIPTTCECPADKRFEGPCKHRTAIAIRPTILDVATQMQLVADGG